jgi:sec-independent protein translocase protein TatC
VSKKEKDDMTFLEHLEELRWVIIRSVAGILIAGTIVFLFKGFIFDHILLAPRNPDFISNRIVCKLGHMAQHALERFFTMDQICINQHPIPMQNITMGGQFNMHVWVSIIGGLILAFPYVFYQFWSFILPALRPKERKYANQAVIISSGLFLLGILFGYYVLLPFSIDFLTTYSVSDQIENKINFVSYISNITTVTLACGLVFEMPIVVYFLTRIGLLTPQFMIKYWRHATIVILIIAAIITPPDVVSQIMVTLPLILLYFASILISKAVIKKKKKNSDQNQN